MGFGIACEVQSSAVPVFMTRYDRYVHAYCKGDTVICSQAAVGRRAHRPPCLSSTLVSKQLEAVAEI